MISKSSLYQRIGGSTAVDAAVEVFYQKVLADDSVSFFFTDIDMLQQKRKQRAFLSFVFGGPGAYTGKDMRAAHAHLLTHGLAAPHFDSVSMHLRATLEELNVAADIVEEVMTIAGAARGDVLGQ